MTEEFEACRTRCEWSAEHLPLPSLHDAYESLHMLTVLLTLALCRRDASSCTVPSRFGCQPCGCRIRCPSAFWPVVAFRPWLVAYSSWKTRFVRKSTSFEEQSLQQLSDRSRT